MFKHDLKALISKFRLEMHYNDKILPFLINGKYSSFGELCGELLRCDGKIYSDFDFILTLSITPFLYEFRDCWVSVSRSKKNKRK